MKLGFSVISCYWHYIENGDAIHYHEAIRVELLHTPDRTAEICLKRLNKMVFPGLYDNAKVLFLNRLEVLRHHLKQTGRNLRSVDSCDPVQAFQALVPYTVAEARYESVK